MKAYWLLLACFPLLKAQEADSGLSVPVTLSGVASFSRESSGSNQIERSLAAGVRVLVSPSLQFGPHLFAYAVTDVPSTGYFDYQTGKVTGAFFHPRLTQAYLGYKAELHMVCILLKAGHLASAFGHYPLDYDDTRSALIGPPPTYISNLPLRPDQMPCGLDEVIWQNYDGPVQFSCGGAASSRYGLTPVALSGLPGIEAQVSWNRIDGRFQVTNSSPANPQSLLSRNQVAQWTAGGGYSFHGGLHVGVSGYRGPYLERDLATFVPVGTRLGSYFASGLGVDAQWSRGPWAVEGEWQRFRFGLPGFIQSATDQNGYLQVKRILSPRIFVALRGAMLRPGGAADGSGMATSQIDARQNTFESALGYRINRFQVVKTGIDYSQRKEWRLGEAYWPAGSDLGFKLQLVTSFTALAKAF